MAAPEDDVDSQFRFLVMNVFFTAFFTLEIALVCFGKGIRHYFSNGWDLLDFFIVIVSHVDLVLTFTPTGSDLSTFRILRVLRAFRPLRAVKRWAGMRIVVNALLFSLPGIRDVLLLWIVFWTVFSIVGVQLFSGRFYRCVDSSGTDVPLSIVQSRHECLSMARYNQSEYHWSNSMINFDNVLIGYVSILQVATLEGWEELSIVGIDSPEVSFDEANVFYRLKIYRLKNRGKQKQTQ